MDIRDTYHKNMDKAHQIASISEVENVTTLPYAIRVLLENVLRNYDGEFVTKKHIALLVNWNPDGTVEDIPFKPARVLMQDFTGVPAIVDIASLREEAVKKGLSPETINPSIPVDLVVDHSVQVDEFAHANAYQNNVAKEYERNEERYALLKWGQQAFSNFRVVPPGMGICHQVNLEYLAPVVQKRDGWVFPDSLVGTDSHTPMINGLGVLGWGVGGIEAEAAMLGQPIYFTCPQVIGLNLSGKLKPGVTSTDMVLTITRLLRDYGVVGKFVEVFGSGLENLSVPDRATIGNMSPEFGCTVTYFPIDEQTIAYLRNTNRDEETINRVEAYAKRNNLWRNPDDDIVYTDRIHLDLGAIEPTISGPKRPQDKILLKNARAVFFDELKKERANTDVTSDATMSPIKSSKVAHKNYVLKDGAVVIAAITSCTNTSNPSVMIGAGLLARKAVEKGLSVPPWVKTSLAPGSKVVTQYLTKSGLQKDLEALNFYTVGYGCTSCIGNSGPLDKAISKAIADESLQVAAVLSGNRNFEARVHPEVRMNFLASPLLVVAYALAGTLNIDLQKDSLGKDTLGNPVFLKDIWPTNGEIESVINDNIKKSDYQDTYSVIFEGDNLWRKLKAATGELYEWDRNSTYIKNPPFFQNLPEQPPSLKDISSARVLLKLGDSVTTDHISPAGAFGTSSAAGQYLEEQKIPRSAFNSYGSRRGNHEVMMRGTFANVRIKNQLTDKEGGFTTHFPSETKMTVFEAAMAYHKQKIGLIVLAGKEYGSGSSRDWAAKGTHLLGIKAVIAESYERIHRSNLLGMGILPLQFLSSDSAESLGLTGREHFTIKGISEGLVPGKKLKVLALSEDAKEITFNVMCRLDSEIEIDYYRNGGILHYVLRKQIQKIGH